MHHIIQRSSQFGILGHKRLEEQSEAKEPLHAFGIGGEWDLIQSFLPLGCQLIGSLPTDIAKKLDLRETKPSLSHFKGYIVLDT